MIIHRFQCFSFVLKMPEYFSFRTLYGLDICGGRIKFKERWLFLEWPYKTLSVLNPMRLKLERIMRSCGAYWPHVACHPSCYLLLAAAH